MVNKQLNLVIVEESAEPLPPAEDQVQFESREKPEFALDQSAFLPFYSGRG
jgi:hypothetical protein